MNEQEFRERLARDGYSADDIDKIIAEYKMQWKPAASQNEPKPGAFLSRNEKSLIQMMVNAGVKTGVGFKDLDGSIRGLYKSDADSIYLDPRRFDKPGGYLLNFDNDVQKADSMEVLAHEYGHALHTRQLRKEAVDSGSVPPFTVKMLGERAATQPYVNYALNNGLDQVEQYYTGSGSRYTAQPKGTGGLYSQEIPRSEIAADIVGQRLQQEISPRASSLGNAFGLLGTHINHVPVGQVLGQILKSTGFGRNGANRGVLPRR